MVLSTRGRCNDDAHCFTAWTKIFRHVFIPGAVYIRFLSIQGLNYSINNEPFPMNRYPINHEPSTMNWFPINDQPSPINHQPVFFISVI